MKGVIPNWHMEGVLDSANYKQLRNSAMSLDKHWQLPYWGSFPAYCLLANQNSTYCLKATQNDQREWEALAFYTICKTIRGNKKLGFLVDVQSGQRQWETLPMHHHHIHSDTHTYISGTVGSYECIVDIPGLIHSE